MRTTLAQRLARILVKNILASVLAEAAPLPRKPTRKGRVKLKKAEAKKAPVKPKKASAKRAVYLKTNSSNSKLRRVEVRPRAGGKKSIVPLGPGVDASYLPISQTCPSSCAAKGEGCYAEGLATVRKIEKESEGQTAAEVLTKAIKEVAAATPPPGRWLRLNVSGDLPDGKAAQAMAAAVAGTYAAAGGGAWTYTHNWKKIERNQWGGISCLASVDRPEEAAEARARGYAPAIVYDFPDAAKAFPIAGAPDLWWLPCPAENPDRPRPCVECRACFDPARLMARKIGIAFRPHGQGKDRLMAALAEVRKPELVQLGIKKAA